MRHRPSRVLSFGAAFSSLALVAGSCGGDGGSSQKVDAEDWIADVCDIAADQADAEAKVTNASLELDITDPQEFKEGFVDLLDEAIDALEDLGDDFEEVGQPDIDGGDKVRDAFLDAQKESLEAARKFRDDVADIDPEDGDFTGQMAELADQEGPKPLKDRLDDLADENDEIAQLVDDLDAECGDQLFSAKVAPARRAFARPKPL